MDLKISEMLDLQRALYEQNKEHWEAIEPKSGKNKLLWMIAEIGEVIDIIKKKGEQDIMEDEKIRHAFVEEMSDVLMYYMDILRCFDIDEQEISNAYHQKSHYNLQRNYQKEEDEFLK